MIVPQLEHGHFPVSQSSGDRALPAVTDRKPHTRTASWRNPSEVDGLILKLFDDKKLRKALLQNFESKINLRRIWEQTYAFLARYHGVRPRIRSEPIDTHLSIVHGLQGASMLIAGAMLWDSVKEAQDYYGVTAKTLRSRLRDTLTAQEGELALRAGRVTEAVASVCGDYEAARAWLRTPNFALGGAIPRDLLTTSEGESIVLGELQTQAEGGPL